MFNKQHLKKTISKTTDIVIQQSFFRQRKKGVSYIHSPYPIEVSPLLNTALQNQMVIIIGETVDSVFVGCLFVRLDNLLFVKLRHLHTSCPFHTIIIDMAPQATFWKEQGFVLRLQQLSKQLYIHCILIDRSQYNHGYFWPIFSMILVWKKEHQHFVLFYVITHNEK